MDNSSYDLTTSDSESSLPVMRDCLSCQQNVNKSLYWYVRKSLEGMLEDYMSCGNDPSSSTIEKVERSDLITQMCDLPLEYDTKSKNLAVALVIQSIRLNVEFTDACATLLMALSQRRVVISDLLKTNFKAVVSCVFNEEDVDLNPTSTCVEEQKLQEQLSLLKDPSSPEIKEITGKLERLRTKNTANGQRYAKLVMELFRRTYLPATQVLIYLKKLSEKRPNYFSADILIFMLVKIGQDLEKRVTKGVTSGYAPIQILSRAGSNDMSSSRDNSTFDHIYNRLDSFFPFATSSKSLAAVKKIAADRKIKKEIETKRSGSASAEYVSRRNRHITKTSSLGMLQSNLVGGNINKPSDEASSKL